jgi:predicted DNA binding CopG/RHH family protein
MRKQPNKPPIPENVSRQELAAFWDTHSIGDYWDELKAVKVSFAKKLDRSFTVRFDEKTSSALERQADEQGIGPTTLIRMLVKRQLQI